VGLEAGRGVAAILVVALHTWDHCAQAYGWFGLGWLFGFGHAGVDFFFVLSGFIILHVHGGDIGRPARLPRFAERRLTRIYPLYWVVSAFRLAAIALAGRPWPGYDAVLPSATLAPTRVAPILEVAWTLQHEILFYALFAVLIAHRRAGLAVFAAWLLLVLATATAPAAMARTAPDWPAWDTLASFFSIEFFLGMAAAWFCARRAVPHPRALLLAGAVAFLAIGLAEDTALVADKADLTHLGYGLAATAMVLGLVGAERAGRLAVPRPLAALGGASYAIYLTHLLTIGAVWQGLRAAGLAALLPGWAAFLVLVVASCVAGLAISVAVERPLIARLRRLLGSVGTPRPAAPRPAA
jgi:peptidoglycan/LPS O-acetylase OafA/YrhL